MSRVKESRLTADYILEVMIRKDVDGINPAVRKRLITGLPLLISGEYEEFVHIIGERQFKHVKDALLREHTIKKIRDDISALNLLEPTNKHYELTVKEEKQWD